MSPDKEKYNDYKGRIRVKPNNFIRIKGIKVLGVYTEGDGYRFGT
jgi:hypothetical protein